MEMGEGGEGRRVPINEMCVDCRRVWTPESARLVHLIDVYYLYRDLSWLHRQFDKGGRARMHRGSLLIGKTSMRFCAQNS